MNKNKKDKRLEFNIHLDEEDRKVIDSLMNQNIKITGLFKTFIRQYLSHIEKSNNEFYNNSQIKT